MITMLQILFIPLTVRDHHHMFCEWGKNCVLKLEAGTRSHG